jgi:hypothetical protein
MDNSDLFSIIDSESRPAKTKSKKRKWREIEEIQDRQRLRRELAELGSELDYEFDLLEV